MTLKKFLKYFDDMNELYIYDWNKVEGIPWANNKTSEEICLLFRGHVFDKGAKKKLKELYKQNYVLERNEDGMAVMLFPYKNEYGANLCKVQINVKKKKIF